MSGRWRTAVGALILLVAVPLFLLSLVFDLAWQCVAWRGQPWSNVYALIAQKV